MKSQTLAARIAAKLTNKNGAIAQKYADVEKVLLGSRYHGRSYSGSGRYVHTTNGKHYSTIEGLTLIGVDFTTGNDAKFGGKTGDFVELTAKGKRQVAEWAKMRKAEIKAVEDAIQKAMQERKAQRITDIKYKLEIIKENAKTVAEFFPETPSHSSICKGRKEMTKKANGDKIHGLAKELGVYNDIDFRDALNFYFFGEEYKAGNWWEGELTINYNEL